MQTQRQSMSDSAPIDVLPVPDAMALMIASHGAAVASVQDAIVEISQAAALVAETFMEGGCVHYAAAGSSGLMALADACELPGTFRVPADQIRIFMAGGVPVDGKMPGDTEDDVSDALQSAQSVRPGDTAIVVSASGTTPYALGFADEAARRGARIVGIACHRKSDLLVQSDIAIALCTGAEVVEGSTRLGAGTAQKVALNMISTQTGVLMGHVHDGMMVNLHPENIKLRRRATDIVSRISGVSSAHAENALESAGYNTKLATLIAFGVKIDQAEELLSRHGGHLRACLGDLDDTNKH